MKYIKRMIKMHKIYKKYGIKLNLKKRLLNYSFVTFTAQEAARSTDEGCGSRS